MAKKQNGKREGKRNSDLNSILVYALLLVVAFSIRVAVVRRLPNDAPEDGRVYDQIARNVIERHVYSHESEPPYSPSLIRMPGYPLFLAGVYSVSAPYGKTAVRIIQALMDTATCALVALVAFFWEPDEKRKRRSSIAALALAALCPFTTIYVATILTETATMFFAVGMCLTATLALRPTSQRKSLWWVTTGLLAGIAVLFRPDSGLFALALGITLVVVTLARASEVKLTRKREEMLYRTARAAYLGAVFSLAFCVVLVPWAIRNYRVFHFFQPLSPAHAEMPGEFVPRGYLAWVRTWIDDPRYIGPVIWSLDYSSIKLADMPDRAFDSADEKQKVGELLEKYNHSSEEPGLFIDDSNSKSPPAPGDPSNQNQESETGKTDNSNPQKGQADQPDGENGDEADDKEAEGDEEDPADENAPAEESANQAAEMTPEIDAGFAQIARARITRNPLRYYVLLPLKRAHTLWFDTHSDYYPFQGELLPLDDLDYRHYQQYFLPLFAGLTLLYTLLGIAGGWFLWQARNFISRQWLLLAALMIFLRLGFFSTLENPEPRYVVEIFPFLSILGGIAVVRIGSLLKTGKA